MRLGGLALEGVQADGAVVAVEDAVVQGVQALALVLLAADRAALGLVGEVAEHEPGLDEAAVLLQRAGERQLAARGLQSRDKQARGHRAVLQRGCAADELVPAVADEVEVSGCASSRPAGVSATGPGAKRRRSGSPARRGANCRPSRSNSAKMMSE